MKIDRQQLIERTYARKRPSAYIRVGLDTGGIAAGASLLYDRLKALVNEKHLPIEVEQVGSLGLSYLDPVVEIQSATLPRLFYGHIQPEMAEELLSAHIDRNEVLDRHVIARFDPDTRPDQTPAPNGKAPHLVFVLDTDTDENDKTDFILFSLREEIKRSINTKPPAVIRALDMRLYNKGVVVWIPHLGITYTHVLAPDVTRIVHQTLIKGEAVEDLRFTSPERQNRIVLRNCGLIDPERIEDYLAVDGYQSFAKVLFSPSSDPILDELKASGLRGRGGAGFPTWLKWKITRDVQSDIKYVICNGDEGDPGAFMDRSVLESDPHSVIEGLLIAARCIGATTGYFYIRAEYPLAIKRMQKALDQAKELGLIGKDILGSGWDFDMKIRLGAGAFVCGEETALIASIEGKRGSPSPRPPYPSVSGLWGKPTAINNVETLAGVPAILQMGGATYGSIGHEQSKGTKVFAVTGKVRNAQLIEVPMGTTLRDIVYEICGGCQGTAAVKAVQTGGPSGGVIPEAKLDSPVSYESLRDLGSIMGSGGMLVMDENDCMVDIAKFYLKFCVDESCGKCAPCRVGGYQMLQLLDKIARGMGEASDLPLIRSICVSMQNASLCGLGQTAPNPVLSTLRYFENEYQAYIEGGRSYARKMKKLREGGEVVRIP